MVSRFANSHQIRISAAAAKDILEIYDYVVEIRIRCELANRLTITCFSF